MSSSSLKVQMEFKLQNEECCRWTTLLKQLHIIIAILICILFSIPAFPLDILFTCFHNGNPICILFTVIKSLQKLFEQVLILSLTCLWVVSSKGLQTKLYLINWYTTLLLFDLLLSIHIFHRFLYHGTICFIYQSIFSN